MVTLQNGEVVSVLSIREETVLKMKRLGSRFVNCLKDLNVTHKIGYDNGPTSTISRKVNLGEDLLKVVDELREKHRSLIQWVKNADEVGLTLATDDISDIYQRVREAASILGAPIVSNDINQAVLLKNAVELILSTILAYEQERFEKENIPQEQVQSKDNCTV
jgi:hypothetical protein